MTDNRHRAELIGGPREGGPAAIYPVITCESGADVSVSQIAAGLILGHQENPVSFMTGPGICGLRRTRHLSRTASSINPGVDP